MSRKSTLLKTDTFGTRSSRLKKYGEKDISYIGIILTLVAIVLDFSNVFSRYDVIMREGSVAMLIATTLASVIILDVPMYVAGCVMKEQKQGLISKKEADFIVIGAVSAFVIIAILNLWLSIECAKYLLEDPSIASNFSVFSEVESTNSVTAGAIILGMQPILTSIATFVVGLYCSNPLLRTVNNIKKELNEIYSFLMQARRAMAEITMCDPEINSVMQKFFNIKKILDKSDPTNEQQQLLIIEMLEDFVNSTKQSYFNSSLFEYSVNSYKAAIQNVYAQEHMREQATLAALQKKLNTPDDISSVSKYAVDLAKNNKPHYVVNEDISI